MRLPFGSWRELLTAVVVRVAYEFVSVDDGSSHRVETYGEAFDVDDKATAKALTAAFKTAMIQTFCIPVHGSEDADARKTKLNGRSHAPEPIQGWLQWVEDIRIIVESCESEQAIDLVQERNRDLLKTLSREERTLYACLGAAFENRRRSFCLQVADRARVVPAPAPLASKRRRQPAVVTDG